MRNLDSVPVYGFWLASWCQGGQVWADRSGGRARFGMLYKLERGMGLTQQIDAALAQPLGSVA